MHRVDLVSQCYSNPQTYYSNVFCSCILLLLLTMMMIMMIINKCLIHLRSSSVWLSDIPKGNAIILPLKYHEVLKAAQAYRDQGPRPGKSGKWRLLSCQPFWGFESCTTSFKEILHVAPQGLELHRENIIEVELLRILKIYQPGRSIFFLQS